MAATEVAGVRPEQQFFAAHAQSDTYWTLRQKAAADSFRICGQNTPGEEDVMAMRLCNASGAIAFALFGVYFPAAQADQPRFYAGAEDIARANIKVKSSSLLTAGLPAPDSTKDRSETGWRFFAGYRFNPYLAIEGGYAVIGDFSFDSTAPGGTVRVNSMEIKALNLGAVVGWPLGYKLSLHARGGLVRSQADTSVTTTGTAAVPRGSFADKDWGYHVGVGAGWDPHEHIGVRIGWERYRVTDGLGSDGDVDLLSWGVRIKF